MQYRFSTVKLEVTTESTDVVWCFEIRNSQQDEQKKTPLQRISLKMERWHRITKIHTQKQKFTWKKWKPILRSHAQHANKNCKTFEVLLSPLNTVPVLENGGWVEERSCRAFWWSGSGASFARQQPGERHVAYYINIRAPMAGTSPHRYHRWLSGSKREGWVMIHSYLKVTEELWTVLIPMPHFD